MATKKGYTATLNLLLMSVLTPSILLAGEAHTLSSIQGAETFVRDPKWTLATPDSDAQPLTQTLQYSPLLAGQEDEGWVMVERERELEQKFVEEDGWVLLEDKPLTQQQTAALEAFKAKWETVKEQGLSGAVLKGFVFGKDQAFKSEVELSQLVFNPNSASLFQRVGAKLGSAYASNTAQSLQALLSWTLFLSRPQVIDYMSLLLLGNYSEAFVNLVSELSAKMYPDVSFMTSPTQSLTNWYQRAQMVGKAINNMGYISNVTGALILKGGSALASTTHGMVRDRVVNNYLGRIDYGRELALAQKLESNSQADVSGSFEPEQQESVHALLNEIEALEHMGLRHALVPYMIFGKEHAHKSFDENMKALQARVAELKSTFGLQVENAMNQMVSWTTFVFQNSSVKAHIADLISGQAGPNFLHLANMTATMIAENMGSQWLAWLGKSTLKGYIAQNAGYLSTEWVAYYVLEMGKSTTTACIKNAAALAAAYLPIAYNTIAQWQADVYNYAYNLVYGSPKTEEIKKAPEVEPASKPAKAADKKADNSWSSWAASWLRG